MNRNRSVAVGVIALSILGIVVIVASLLNIRPPGLPPTPTTTPSPTPDPCGPGNIERTIMEFDKLSREFNDAFVLAQNTPAVQLAPGITEMQRIRRSAEDYSVPTCLEDLKNYQLGFMNTAIGATMVLFSSFSGDASQAMTQEQVESIIKLVNQRMYEASQFSVQYTTEMAGLLGVTLTPFPTPEVPAVPQSTVSPAPTIN